MIKQVYPHLNLKTVLASLFLLLFIQQSIAQTSGSIDRSFATDDKGLVITSVVRTHTQADGNIIAVGVLSYSTDNNETLTRGIIRVKSDGSFDTTFKPGLGINAEGSIKTMIGQSDGKIVIGGDFISYNGVARAGVARLNADGSLDTTFVSDLESGGKILTLAQQSDGKIIIGGVFTNYGGTPRKNIARLNADGSLDTGFNADGNIGTNTFASVNTVAFQSNGKMIVGGSFTNNSGINNYVARLNNNGSLDTGFNSGGGPDGIIMTCVVQPDDKVIIGGNFLYFNDANYGNRYEGPLARLDSDGNLDYAFNTSTTLNVSVERYISNIALQTDGKILVVGLFSYYNGSLKKNIIRLNSNGLIDVNFNSSANGEIHSVTIESDNKILIGGAFTTYNNSTNASTRIGIAKLNYNSSNDLTFAVNTGFNNTVYAVIAQPDEKIIVAGSFIRVNNLVKNFIVRLNNNGSLDSTFNPIRTTDADIIAAAIQPDNKILISGSFTSYGGSAAYFTTRLNTDGTKDTDFLLGTSLNSVVYALALQENGKIVIGGSFTRYANSTPIIRIGRLNADGTLDTDFQPGMGFNNTVRGIDVQPDGKIIAVGQFTTYNGNTATRIARLNADGSIDTSFMTGTGFDQTVYGVKVQKDGKILVGGLFNTYNGTPINGIARLNTDGSLDTTFNIGIGTNAGGYIYSFTIQSDDKIIATGGFTSFNGTTVLGIVRLNPDGSLDSAFNVGAGADNSVLVSCLQSDNKVIIGGAFTTLNEGRKNRLMRLHNCISPLITTQAKSVSVTEGKTSGFSVSATGVNLSYQWQHKIGAGDFIDIEGANQATLTFVNTALAQNGNQYRVIVLSGTCQTISDTVNLNVKPSAPIISSFSPLSAPVGSSVTIKGAYFNPVTTENIVDFGGIKANVLSASADSLVLIVPLGATSKYLSVTNLGNNLTTYAQKSFIVTSNGSFSFIPSNAAKTPYISEPEQVIVADIDSDGKIDILSANNDGSGVAIFRNTSDTNEVSFSHTDFVGNKWIWQVEAEDLDGDGKRDLTLLMRNEGIFSVLPNQSTIGNISWGLPSEFNTGANAHSMAIGDLNNDGKPDIVISKHGDEANLDSTVAIYQNISALNSIQFAAPIIKSVKGLKPGVLKIKDIDGDGLNDLIVANLGSNSVSILKNTSVVDTIMFNDTLAVLKAITEPSALAIEDFDADGRLDIAITDAQNNKVLVFHNTVGNVFLKQELTTEAEPRSIETGDINGDGKLDLVIANAQSGSVSMYQNTSSINNISFLSKSSFTALREPMWVAIADLNNDTKYDFITANYGVNGISYALQGSCDYTEQNESISDNALKFDGINDYVEISNCSAKPLNLTDAITIEYWFKGTKIQSAVRLQNNFDDFIAMGWQNSAHLITNGGVIDVLPIDADVTDNKWHHIAMTWKKGETDGFKSYVDGVLTATEDASSMNLPTINTNWYIGALLGDQERMKGTIDELRIWNVARSETQIAGSMSVEPADKAGLLIYYKFNHGAATENNAGLTQIKNSIDSTMYMAYLRNFALIDTISNFVAGAPNAPVISVVGASTICNPDSLILQTTGCAGEVKWSYNNATGTSLAITTVGIYSISAICNSDGYLSKPSNVISDLIIKAQPAAPSIIAPSETVVCNPDSLLLTATGCSGIITWSDNSTGTTLVISTVGSYTITATCTVDGCTSKASEAVAVHIKAKPATPIISGGGVVCAPATITLSATGCAGTVNWSDNSTGTSLILSATGTYSVSAVCIVDGCSSDTSEVVNAQIKAKPAAPVITGAGSVCFPSTITLTATGCAGSVIWSNASTGTSLSITQTGTYNYTAVCTVDACTSDNSLAAIATIFAQPIKPVISPQAITICPGTSTNLSVSCPDMSINWSNGATTSTISVSPQASSNYTVTCTSVNNCTSAASNSATITVANAIAKPTITASASTICTGGALTLTASACDNGTLIWTGGMTGTAITISPNNNSSYRVLCRTTLGCQSDSSNAFVPTIVAIPTVPSIQNKLISAGTSTSLTASCASGSSVWYGATTGGAALAIGAFITPVLNQHTNYYVSCETNPGNATNCQSSRVMQAVTVDKFEITKQLDDVTVCPGQNVIFSINISGASVSYQWQENRGSGWQNIVNGGVYAGATTSTLRLTAPTSAFNGYLYRCVVTNAFPNGIPASATSAAVLLSTQGSASNTLSIVSKLVGIANVYQAVSTITATNVIESNAKVSYFSGNSITLNPGFEVKAGSYFQAKIQSVCSN